MKNKKGFTLIELLAVIVVLSIIALIAVPIILNVIDKAKQGSAIDGAYGYIDAVEKSVAIGNINQDKGITIPSDNELKLGDIDDTLILDKISVKGKKPDYIEMTFEKGKVKTAGFCVDGFNIKYENKKANITNTDYCQFFNVDSIEVIDEDNKLQVGINDNEYNLNLTGSGFTFKISVNTKDNSEIIPELMVAESTNLENNIIVVTENNGNYTIVPKSQGSTFIIIKAGIKYKKININVINDSILGYLEQKTYNQEQTNEDIIVNGVTYPAHVYYYEGNQVWGENMSFGNDDDIGTASSYATRMVIVKVNGDLTINAGVKIEPYYTGFGGPKGFLLYVTGTLTNNGTIDNSHGAKAVGQDVYLWQNSDNTYEYVPAAGGSGGGSVTKQSDGCIVGPVGGAGKDRSTGGGAGGTACRWSTPKAVSGAGSAGTSYSGGSGGGSAATRDGNRYGGTAAANGGAGGTGSSKGTETNNGAKYAAGGGAGNPGGTGQQNASNGYFYGSNGTGGLLIISASNVINNSIISANGSSGGGRTSGSIHAHGGSSGGGSINIFYNNSFSNTGSIRAAGGLPLNNRGGAGGAGTVTIGKIENGVFNLD